MPDLYQYYTPYNCKEHMLYLKEIAKIFGIYTIKGDPHSRLISAAFKDYEKEINETLPLYYYAGRSLLRVYPKNQYMPVITKLLANLNDYEYKDEVYCYVDSNNNRHKFKVKNEYSKAV